MTGTDRIKARIRDDARAASEETLRIAREEADRLLSSARAQAAAKAAEDSIRGEREADAVSKRLIAVAELETRKDALRTRQEVVAAAYAGARVRLAGLDEDATTKLLAPLVADAAGSEGGVLLLSERDAGRLGSSLVDAVNARLSGKARVVLADRPAAIDGGFILCRGEMEINGSLDILLAQVRPALEKEIVEILFGSDGRGGNV